MSLTIRRMPEWTSLDRERLGTFLQTPTGAKLKEALQFNAPSVLVGLPLERTALSGAVHSGYQQALHAIDELVNPSDTPDDKPLENFPSLDSDEGWPETLKLNPVKE